MKTYSLFIIKPGFIQSFAKIKEVMGKNNIKVVTEYKGKLEKDVLAKHYAEHFGKPFYNKLIEYMSDGRIGDIQFDNKVVVMVVSSAIKNESEQDFITRSRKVVKEILRPEFEQTSPWEKATYNSTKEALNRVKKAMHMDYFSDKNAIVNEWKEIIGK